MVVHGGQYVRNKMILKKFGERSDYQHLRIPGKEVVKVRFPEGPGSGKPHKPEQ
jgi:hypothetical protein